MPLNSQGGGGDASTPKHTSRNSTRQRQQTQLDLNRKPCKAGSPKEVTGSDRDLPPVFTPVTILPRCFPYGNLPKGVPDLIFLLGPLWSLSTESILAYLMYFLFFIGSASSWTEDQVGSLLVLEVGIHLYTAPRTVVQRVSTAGTP